MTVYIGADHRGFSYKEQLKPFIVSLGHKVADCGNDHPDPEDDYPDFAFAVADKVAADKTGRGIVICGSGGGVTIAANRVPGIRCTQGFGEADVFHNREHNDANVLALGEDVTGLETAKVLIKVFLTTKFTHMARCERRIAKIKERD
jgi:ribose 5-phosphate isomerase B